MNREILSYLDEIIPNPKCELNYNKDYELLIAVMLSAQTTDRRVNIVTNELFTKYDTLEKLSNAELKDVERIVYQLGSYTKKSKAVIEIAKAILLNNGNVPDDRSFLESLPMVGRKTTNVVLSELFELPNIAVDTHVERIAKRLKLVSQNANVLEVEKALKKQFPKDKWCRLHLQIVHFGRYYCTAKNPKCDNCKLKNVCSYYKEKFNN